MRLSVHCLGGSLKPAGLGDGLKPNSCLPPAQLLLMNRIIPSAQASSIKHQVSSIEHRVSSIEHFHLFFHRFALGGRVFDRQGFLNSLLYRVGSFC
jgi:hypothetical protein